MARYARRADIKDLSEMYKLSLVDSLCNEKDLLVPHALDGQLVNLTKQQFRCFKLLLQGCTAKEIAEGMNLSYRTIQHYTGSIYERLGLGSSREFIQSLCISCKIRKAFNFLDI
jgi:DNA-binding CsgD family transcriptional regulator